MSVPTAVRKIEEILDSVSRQTRIKSDRFKLALREIERTISDNTISLVARECNIERYSIRTPVIHTVVRHFMLKGGYVTPDDVPDPTYPEVIGPANDWSDDYPAPDNSYKNVHIRRKYH